jgi:ATP-binding cassette subfamily B protein/subfamily B ATP-binding cassette protein MsbA
MHKYRRLLQYARRQRFHFVAIFALTVASSALAALQPWPMKLLADHVLGTIPLSPRFNSVITNLSLQPTPGMMLVLVAAGSFTLFLLNSLFEVVLTQSWIIAGRRMVYELSQDLFAKLQRRSLLFHSRNSVGDIMTRVTSDSWCVYRVFDTMLFAPGNALLTIVWMVFLMSRLDATLTLFALITAPFMVGASFFVGKPLRMAAKLKRDIESRIQSHVQQTLTGIPVVQAFAQEEREQERFEQFADTVIRAQQRSTLIGSLNTLSSGLIATLGTGMILWFGARHVLAGSLTIGGMLVFVVYLNSLQTQMKTLAAVHTALQGLSASVDRVMEVLDAPPEIATKPGAPALPAIRGHVRIEKVTFGYEPGRAVLREISLEVEPGQSLALVGASGAGKTTLVNLIPRFFDPWQGRVLIDGQDAREVQLESLRSQIGLVLQEPFLFPLSVADNIAFGKPSASREQIEAAARAANAHDFIQRLPRGYDTVIGERGATLSGGERQRLSIARALLKDAPFSSSTNPPARWTPERNN